jgi:hypothetical protein
MRDGIFGLRITKNAPLTIFLEHYAPPGRPTWTMGSGRDTGAAARRGHDDMRRGHHRTHPRDAAARLATAPQPATLTSACSCLVDARDEGATAAHTAVQRERRPRCARHHLTQFGHDARPRLRPSARLWSPARPTESPISRLKAAPMDASTLENRLF